MNPVSAASGSIPQILNAQDPPLATLAPWLEPREAPANRAGWDRGRFWRRWRGALGPEVVRRRRTAAAGRLRGDEAAGEDHSAAVEDPHPRSDAAQANVVAFRSDGAPWIWDRLDWVIRRLGLKAKQVSRGLDWCHAVHHISLALEPLVEEADRKRVFKKLRKWLKAGSWRKVVRELMILTVDAEDAKLPKTAPVWTEIDSLERHGNAGHLDYATYQRRGLPLGSGAIESVIRRVINLRMKGNSIFWKEENAEAMLTLRGLVLSGRWKTTFEKITESMAHDRRLDWEWQSPDMPAELKAGTEITPPKPQPQSLAASYAAAA
jgi:hypothetical protein